VSEPRVLSGALARRDTPTQPLLLQGQPSVGGAGVGGGGSGAGATAATATAAIDANPMLRRSVATRPLAVSQTGAVHGERSLARSLSMATLQQQQEGGGAGSAAPPPPASPR
jgi:hypothetical protein